MNSEKNFFEYWIRKINANKDIISTSISVEVLLQTILFSVLDEESKDFFKDNYIILFLFAIIIIIVLCGWLFLYLFFDENKNSSMELRRLDGITCSRRDDALQNREVYMKKLQIHLLRDVEKIEKEIQSNEQIWVLTSDVNLETTNSIISETMGKNLEKGVIYKYFIPDTIKNSASIMALMRKYEKYPNFSIIRIEKNYKLLFERFDVIIYMPDTDSRMGFICVNFSEDDNLIAFKQFSDEDTKTIIGQLENIRKV